MIPLLLGLISDDRNFLFHLTAEANLTLFAYIMHYDTKKVLVRNTSNRPLHILHRQRLGQIVDICYNNCFFANAKSAFNLATITP